MNRRWQRVLQQPARMKNGNMAEQSLEHQVQWAAWVQMWWIAVGRQADRIEKASFDNMQPDVLLFVQSLNNLARGARRVLGAGHPDVANFDRSQPDLKDLRDMLEHSMRASLGGVGASLRMARPSQPSTHAQMGVPTQRSTWRIRASRCSALSRTLAPCRLQFALQSLRQVADLYPVK